MGICPIALYGAICADLGVVGPRDLPPECDAVEFAKDYLVRSVIRKLIPDDTREADANALASFTSANNRCREWQFIPEWEVDRVLLGEIQQDLENFFNPGGEPLIKSYYDLLKHGRPGPGVNVGAFGTSYYTKYFASPLTCTSAYLYEMYKSYADWIPFLSNAECQRYESIGYPHIVSGSRCSFVPKTSRTSRMICIEPSLNLWYQLGLADILERRLSCYYGITLTLQPQVNHSLARQGSLNQEFSTLDLSSASDSISLRLCELLLPKWFFELLLQLRSRTTEIAGQTVPLFMVSTMGCGFTFPLQTIIFSAIIRAVNKIYGRDRQLGWSCFGDDLICHKDVFVPLKRALALFNFSVNPDKTFSEGPFRESCGADWFYGQPVRPVFIRRLKSQHDLVIAINQLNEWSAYTGVFLRKALSYLISNLRAKFRNFVPFDSNLDEGIRVPLSFVGVKRFDANGSFVFRSYRMLPNRIRIYEGKIRLAGRLTKRNLLYNPDGLYCSFLFGELASFSIMVRHNRKMKRAWLRHSPYWDYVPVGSLTNGVRLSWQRWETAVAVNCQDLTERSEQET
jgi:hypothetical protein